MRLGSAGPGPGAWAFPERREGPQAAPPCSPVPHLYPAHSSMPSDRRPGHGQTQGRTWSPATPPTAYGCHRTYLRWAADRPKPARSTFQQGQGQVGAGTGALWGPGDPRSLRAASARPGSCLGPDGLSQGGRFWAASTQKAQDGAPECGVGGPCA